MSPYDVIYSVAGTVARCMGRVLEGNEIINHSHRARLFLSVWAQVKRLPSALKVKRQEMQDEPRRRCYLPLLTLLGAYPRRRCVNA